MTVTTIVIFLISLVVFFITKSLSLMFSTISYLLHKSINFLSFYGFALSPIPSYLPQLLSLLQYQQNRKKDEEIIVTTMDNCQQQKRKTSDDMFTTNTTNEIHYYNDYGLQKHPSQEDLEIHAREENNGGNGKKGGKSEVGGMSLYSIYILLLSHIIRLVYFSTMIFNKATEEEENTPHDLILQSIVMVIIQFSLWYTMVNVQQHHNKEKFCSEKKEMEKKKNASSSSSSYFSLVRRNHELFLLGCFIFFVTIYFQLSSSSSQYSNNDIDESSNEENQNQQRLLQFSIFLESNLALPQFLQNYHHRSTKNLSLIMIFNWMIGDCFKAAYFVISNNEVSSGGGGGGDRWLFICGSLYSLLMDIAVWIQCVYWYPSVETIKKKEWFKSKIGYISKMRQQRRVVLGREDDDRQGKIHDY